MSAGVLGLLLAAAVAHAAWNLTAKRLAGDPRVIVSLYAAGSLVVIAPFGVWQWAHHGWAVSPVLLLAPLASGALRNLYALALQAGYARADLGVVYPTARGVGPSVAMVLAVVVLGERPPLLALAGGAVVILGIAVVTGGLAVLRRPAVATGLMFGALSGLGIAGYTVLDGWAVGTEHVPPLTFLMLAEAASVVILAPAWWPGRRHARDLVRARPSTFAAVWLLMPLSYGLVLWCLRTTDVSIVAPVRECSIVIGALAAGLLYKEAHLRRRVLGSLVVLGGIALVSAG
ncbi:DMT family transporter [Demequina pelophila]|uniref:DMT family transporter n=1 Tax=Demequina pelophila TaxID=1638984 RepID=UPI00078056BA|nr:DMT family transporter [Demequina pelophila]